MLTAKAANANVRAHFNTFLKLWMFPETQTQRANVRQLNFVFCSKRRNSWRPAVVCLLSLLSRWCRCLWQDTSLFCYHIQLVLFFCFRAETSSDARVVSAHEGKQLHFVCRVFVSFVYRLFVCHCLFPLFFSESDSFFSRNLKWGCLCD